MDLSYGERYEAFRAEVRAFLGANWPPSGDDEALGGIGFTWEGDVQLYFKRAMFDRAFLGSPESHRARAAELGGW